LRRHAGLLAPFDALSSLLEQALGTAQVKIEEMAGGASTRRFFPATLNTLLRDLPETWTHQNEGENTWSAFDIVGHLVHCEHADWMPRVNLLLQFGETQAFAPFDRLGHQRAVQGKSLTDYWMNSLSCGQKSGDLGALNLQPVDLGRRGQHPTFGSVTLSALLATWAAHDLTHLHQISRVMAHQYRAAVGPWSAYSVCCSVPATALLDKVSGNAIVMPFP